MLENLALYPRLWGLSQPDTNIDHRRVPNLQKFFERVDAKVSEVGAVPAYRAGQISRAVASALKIPERS
jgi:uncharacterized protein YijF (DUF1287 family)